MCVKSAAKDKRYSKAVTQLFQIFYFQRLNKQTKKYLFQYRSIDASAPSFYQRDLSAHKMSQDPPMPPLGESWGAPEGRRRFPEGLFERKNAPGYPRSFHAEWKTPSPKFRCCDIGSFLTCCRAQRGRHPPGPRRPLRTAPHAPRRWPGGGRPGTRQGQGAALKRSFKKKN